MAGASLLMPFLPLLPKQILLINFITDFPALTLSSDHVDHELVKTPRRWDIRVIRNFMFTFGLISSVFDYLTFFVLLYVFKVNEIIFQSSWFLLSILTELIVLLIMRTQKPFFQSQPAPLLLYSSLGVVVFTFLIPFLPFQNFLGIVPIPFSILLTLFSLTVLYIVVTEFVKYLFYKRK
jgi:Mg2+-importing ATPase